MLIASKGHLQVISSSVLVVKEVHVQRDVLLGADTASDTKFFRDESDFGSRVDFDTEFT